MKRFVPLFAVTAVITCVTTTRAAIITVNTEDNTDFSAGKTNLVAAINSLHDGDTISFNVPGTAAESNWSRRMHLTVRELTESPAVRRRMRTATFTWCLRMATSTQAPVERITATAW